MALRLLSYLSCEPDDSHGIRRRGRGTSVGHRPSPRDNNAGDRMNTPVSKANDAHCVSQLSLQSADVA